MQPIDRKILRRFFFFLIVPHACAEAVSMSCVYRAVSNRGRDTSSPVGRSKNGTAEKKRAALNAHSMLLVAP